MTDQVRTRTEGTMPERGGELEVHAQEQALPRISALRPKALGPAYVDSLTEEDRRQVVAFLRGGRLESKLARELESRVAKAGNYARTKAVRQRRMEMDRSRALELLSMATQTDPQELYELAMSLKQYHEFGYARRLLVLACERVESVKYPKVYRRLFQQAALCTYKDPDLPFDWKLECALRLLGKTENLRETQDPESLGIAGAIYKRKWERDGRRENLERALAHYLRGYAQGAPPGERRDILGCLRRNPAFKMDASVDFGYTGINAAFVLDLLAAQMQQDGIQSFAGDSPLEGARLIREEIIRSVPALVESREHSWLAHEWWYYATVGEAYFGLHRYTEAKEWLISRSRAAGLQLPAGCRGSGFDVDQWEYESTARQLATLARVQHQFSATGQETSEKEFVQTAAAKLLTEFLGGDSTAVLSAFRGKVGLALSGGGFRASLFHIGVLARLAEIGALKHVEVLSCVSGGSILGAYYYLELRNLLQAKSDKEIKTADYVNIVRRIEREFLAGVQRNIRTRVLAEFLTNLKVALLPHYSRTRRLGELYEEELYSRIENPEDRSQQKRRRLLSELRIFPRDRVGKRQEDFNPRRDNWRRENKIPMLVLNACSLNTGHNWQFTTSYMGEPPTPINADIDCNYRLRRFHYDEAPPGTRITLGEAVAASSCVPGIFDPLVLEDLYSSGGQHCISVSLVDGGVCDNQGVASLLEQDCSVMLASDGSGQLRAQDTPSPGLLSVPLRTNDILQARVREAQYGDMVARCQASQLRGLMFVHLKQELFGKSVVWRGCSPHQRHCDVYDPKADSRAESSGMTTYGIPRKIQEKLAAIRTDLDSFSDVEAYALMSSGYRMATEQFRGPSPCVKGFANVDAQNWRFLEVFPVNADQERLQRLEGLLDVSSRRAFKVWSLSPVLVALKWLLLSAAVGGLAALLADPDHLADAASSLAWLLEPAGVALLFIVGLFAFALLANAYRSWQRGSFRAFSKPHCGVWKDFATGLSVLLGGWLAARLHLHIFDPLYLRYGRLERFAEVRMPPSKRRG